MNIKELKFNAVFFSCIIFSGISINAQVHLSSISTTTPVNPESILHLENPNDKGFLLTRLSLQATNLPNPLSAHVAGMVVYNTAIAGTSPNNVSTGMYYNDGTKWIKLTTKKPQIGDIKNSFQNTDHNGWYLLDGRLLTALPVNQRNNATALGISTNLLNATDRFLKNTNGTETLGNLSGSDSFTLTQANLPNFNFTGTTSTDGNHTHSYNDNTATANNVVSGTSNPIANNSSTNFNTGASGDHTHAYSFSLGGSTQPISLKPGHIITNVFIYLGN
ncbi:hypothetical protein [Chryseobacterium schmidteae]|uniref:hypothetical protein n=1 Tax=Chryseobacterium schmidteae TaxID=2730404 RepID=UPI0015886B17|nr:hypothetical protein [Chryseobacterium schmidteae]